jgi:Tfp pilus assembly protein PilX
MIKQTNIRFPGFQQGAALLTALALLTVITIVAVVAMNSSNMQLRMANSQEEKANAREIAQSCIDNIINDPNNFVVTGKTGTVKNATVSASVLSEFQNTNLNLTELGMMSAPRGFGSSADKFKAALFDVACSYDNTAANRGKDSLVQGFLLIVPKI